MTETKELKQVYDSLSPKSQREVRNISNELKEVGAHYKGEVRLDLMLAPSATPEVKALPKQLEAGHN